MQVKKQKPTSRRSSTKQSQRSITTPSIFVDFEVDDNEDEEYSPNKQTPDIALPRTPLEGQDRGSVLSPEVTTGTPTGTSSRGRSPVEKLEKLIELYEGSCSMKEYKEYVKPEDEEDQGGDKLETIAESVEEEIRILQQQDSEDTISEMPGVSRDATGAIRTPTPVDQPMQTSDPSPEHNADTPPKTPITPLLDVNSNKILCEDDVNDQNRHKDRPGSGIDRTSVGDSMYDAKSNESDSSSDS